MQTTVAIGQDLEAASAIIGLVLSGCAPAKRVAYEMLRPDDMPSPALAVVFEAALSLGEAADLVTVCNKMGEKGMEKAGGPGWVAGLMDGVGLVDVGESQLRHYCEIVLDGAAKRRLQHVGARLLEPRVGMPAVETVDKALAYLGQIKERASARKTFFSGPEIAAEMLQSYEERRKKKVTGPTFGLASLDSMVESGMEPGTFWVVAARPRIGKTTFLTGTVLRNLRDGKRILHCALEMGLERNIWRLLAQMTGLALSRVKQPQHCDSPLSASEMSALSRALCLDIGETNNYCLVSIPRIEPAAIAEEAEAAARLMGGLDLIVIDYLQLVHSPQRLNSLRERTATTVWDLDATAQRLGVPMLVAAQLNRNAEGNKEDELPTLADLKECGTIEEKASGAILLHRWNVDEWGGPARSPAKIILAKQQDGGTGRIDCVYNRSIPRWEEALDTGAYGEALDD